VTPAAKFIQKMNSQCHREIHAKTNNAIKKKAVASLNESDE
jgi:hypothetical protein